MVKLYIKDNTNGHIHEYGTNQHDSLILMEDGSIHYKNLQNGCGTIFADEGYSFCLADGTDPRTREDYLQHSCESYLDIGGDYYDKNKLRGEDMKTELKLCPFCGGKAEIREFSYGHKGSGEFTASYELKCKNCNFKKIEESVFELEKGQPKFKKNGYEKLVKWWNEREDQ